MLIHPSGQRWFAAPKEPRVTSMPGSDDVLRATLPNGIIVLARENWAAPSVAMRGYVQAGNLDEPDESARAGVIHGHHAHARHLATQLRRDQRYG